MKKLRTFVFLVILLLALVPFSPIGSALTWTAGWTYDDNTAVSSLNADATDMVAFANGTGYNVLNVADGSGYVHLRTTITGNDIMAIRCPTVTEPDCGSGGMPQGSLVADAVATTNTVNVARAGETLVSCVNELTTNDALLRKSVNGGALWSGALIDNGNNQRCTMDGWSDNGYVAVWADSTAGAIEWSSTTTGGAPGSWSAAATVEATTAGAGYGTRVAVENSTDWVVWHYLSTTNDIRSCYTTSAGSSWSCSVITSDLQAASAGSRFSLIHVGGSTFAGVYVDNAEAIIVQISSDGGATWAAVTLGTGTTSVVTADIAAYNQTVWAVSWGEAGSTKPQKVSVTMDGGVVWAPETVFTTTGTHNAGDVGSAIAITPTGHVAAAFVTDPAVINGVRHIQYSTSLVSAAIGASATVTVADLVGFDVDPTGNLIVVRYNDGENVATHDSLTLAQAASVDTNCGSRPHGVMAQTDGTDTFAFYIQCDAGDPIGMRIRTGSLNTPSSSQLNGCGASCADFSLTDFSEAGGDGLSELGEIDAFPISYREQDDAGALTHSFYLAWGWSSQDNSGIVGVNAFSNHQSDLGATDARVSYDIGYSNGNADQICTGTDGEQTYLAAARDASLTRVYPVAFTLEQESGSVTSDLTPQSGGTPTTYSSVQGGGEGIACGDGLVAVLNGGGVWVMNRDGGLYRSYPGVDVDPRGVSLSQETVNSQYLAYVDGAQWFVRDLGDNSTLCFGTMPSGNIVGFSLTGGAQNLFVATDAVANNMARFELGGECTPIVNEETGEDVPPEPSDGAGDLFAPPEIPGVSESGNRIIAAVFCMGLFMGSFGTIPTAKRLYDGRRGTDALTFDERLAMVGLIIGFLFSWQVGYLDVAAVFFAVIAAGALIGSRFFKVSKGE